MAKYEVVHIDKRCIIEQGVIEYHFPYKGYYIRRKRLLNPDQWHGWEVDHCWKVRATRFATAKEAMKRMEAIKVGEYKLIIDPKAPKIKIVAEYDQ